MQTIMKEMDVVKILLCIRIPNLLAAQMLLHKCGMMRLQIQVMISITKVLQEVLVISLNLYGKIQHNLDVVFQEYMLSVDTVIQLEILVADMSKTFFQEEIQLIVQVNLILFLQMTILDQTKTIPILLKNPKNNLNMRINLRSMKKRRPSMKKRRGDLNNNTLKQKPYLGKLPKGF